MMSDDITKIVKGQSCIQDLLKTIQALQKENEMKDIRIKTLENRILMYNIIVILVLFFFFCFFAFFEIKHLI